MTMTLKMVLVAFAALYALSLFIERTPGLIVN
jgi:hypothetical protein